MKKQVFIPIYLLIAVLIVAINSCSDTWDAHYSKVNAKKSTLNLYQYMQTQPDLSRFTEMLKIVGYDSILSKPQTYTVWAPVNSALQSVSMKDTASIAEIVKNHIGRFSNPTSNVDSKVVYMVSKKFITFKHVGGSFTFGGITLITGKDSSDIATSNGILHRINGYVPYVTNIWEYIGKTPGLDSLRAYLYSQNQFIFDMAASTEIGTNSQGLSIYDSVITFSNPVLDKIGRVYYEDSTFTALLPTNAAWTKAYDQIKSNYKTLGINGAAQQRLNTQFAIVNNLFFRNAVPDPSTIDSIISITGNVFKNPGYLFQPNKLTTNLSNGIAFITDSLRFKKEDSYQKSIKIEAENGSYGRKLANSTPAVFSSLGTAFSDSISQSKYLYVEPTGTSSSFLSSVTFPIPNTLSGKYNIYCVFVPATIAQVLTPKKSKVRFYLSYINSAGAKVDSALISNKNVVLATTPAPLPSVVTASTFDTKPLNMTKLFVTQITFPYCNLFVKGAATSTISVKLKVESAALITDLAKYDRNLRIDYVILEPAQ